MKEAKLFEWHPTGKKPKLNSSPFFRTLNQKSKTSKKSMTWSQAKRANPMLNPFGDEDRDGVPNWIDCRPYDKSKHGTIQRVATAAKNIAKAVITGVAKPTAAVGVIKAASGAVSPSKVGISTGPVTKKSVATVANAVLGSSSLAKAAQTAVKAAIPKATAQQIQAATKAVLKSAPVTKAAQVAAKAAGLAATGAGATIATGTKLAQAQVKLAQAVVSGAGKVTGVPLPKISVEKAVAVSITPPVATLQRAPIYRAPAIPGIIYRELPFRPGKPIPPRPGIEIAPKEPLPLPPIPRRPTPPLPLPLPLPLPNKPERPIPRPIPGRPTPPLPLPLPNKPERPIPRPMPGRPTPPWWKERPRPVPYTRHVWKVVPA